MIDFLAGIWQMFGLDQIAISSWIILVAVTTTLCAVTLSNIGATIGVSVEDLLYRIRTNATVSSRPSD